MANFDRLRGIQLFETDLVSRSLQDAKRFTSENIASAFEYQMRERAYGFRDALIESPVEMVFSLWWEAYDWTRGDRPVQLRLLPQEQVVLGGQEYRLDFRVSDGHDDLGLMPRTAVELDGHEFHERTKEQVAWRNQRDRALQIAGWKVFHFSGSEVARDPLSCVRAVYDYCIETWNAGFERFREETDRRRGREG